MQTATTIKAQRTFVDKVEPVTRKLVDIAATICLGSFSAASLYVGALFFAGASFAEILLGVAMLAGGFMFALMAIQSFLELFR